MRLQWIEGESAAARCYACGDPGPHRVVLRDRPYEGCPPAEILACEGCGSRFDRLFVPRPYAPGAGAPWQADIALGLDDGAFGIFERAPAGVRDFLEVGCGLGFCSDFARRMLGWSTLAFDSSPAAEIGYRELGFELRAEELSAATDLGGRRFDLAYACEVIEHCLDPRDLAASVRSALRPDGVFVLRTPNAAVVRPQTPHWVLISALSSTYHAVLLSARALERVLAAAGFAHVRVEEAGETLWAEASGAPLDGPRTGRPAAGVLDEYLRRAAAGIPPGGRLRTALLLRLFERRLAAGAAEEAARALADYRGALLASSGLDFDDPAALGRAAERQAGDAPVLALPGAMLSRGIFERNHAEDRETAARYFVGAARLAERVCERWTVVDPTNPSVHDPIVLGRALGAAVLHESDPAAAAELLAGLLEGPLGHSQDARLRAFASAVGLGACALVEELEPEVRAAVAARPAADVRPETAGALYALGMFALNHRQDAPRAAADFAALARRLTDAARAGGTAAADLSLHGAARFHEAFALEVAGVRETAAAIYASLVEAGAGEAGRPPRDEAFAARAAERLAALRAETG